MKKGIILCLFICLLVFLSSCLKSIDKNEDSKFDQLAENKHLLVEIQEMSILSKGGSVTTINFEQQNLIADLFVHMNNIIRFASNNTEGILTKVIFTTADATYFYNNNEYPCFVPSNKIDVLISPYHFEDLSNIIFEFDIQVDQRGKKNPFFMLQPVIKAVDYEVNNPPNIPTNPNPANGETEVSLTPEVSWECSDPDGDSLMYTVFTSNDSPDNMQYLTTTSQNSIQIYEYNKFPLNTKIYWKIIARDDRGGVTEGPIWSFTTTDLPEGYFELKFSLDSKRPDEQYNIQYEALDSNSELSLLYIDIDRDKEIKRVIIQEGNNEIQLEKGGTYVLGISESSDGSITMLGLIGDSELGLHSLPVSLDASDTIDLGNLIHDGEVFTSELVSSDDLSEMLGYSNEALSTFGFFDVTLKRFLNPDINKNGIYDIDEGIEWELIVKADKCLELGDINLDDVEDPIKIPMEEFSVLDIRYCFRLKDTGVVPEFDEPSLPAKLILPDNLGQITIPGGYEFDGFHRIENPIEEHENTGSAWFHLEEINNRFPPFNGDYSLEIFKDETVYKYWFDELVFLTPEDYMEGFIFPLVEAITYPDGQFKRIRWDWYKMLGNGEYTEATSEEAKMIIPMCYFYFYSGQHDAANEETNKDEHTPCADFEYFGYDNFEGGSINLDNYDCDFWIYNDSTEPRREHVQFTFWDKAANDYGVSFPLEVIGKPENPFPSNGAIDVDTSVTLSWSAFTDGEDLVYSVFFGETTDELTMVGTTTVKSLSFNYELEQGKRYFWKVFSYIEEREQVGTRPRGIESPVWSFTTEGFENSPPNAPTNPQPQDGETGVSLKPLVSWDCSDPDGDSLVYDVYASFDNQDNLQIMAPDYPNNSVQVDDTNKLPENTLIYWKVVAKDGKGGVTEGPIWTFLTGDPVEISFNDAGLESAVRDELGKSDIDPLYEHEVKTIILLDAECKGIEDLSGIETLENLEVLWLWNNNIADVSPIASLTKLISLELNTPSFTDISSLHTLKALEYLNLECSNVTDISVVSQLPSLTGIRLGDSNVGDLSPLYNLTNLNILDISSLSLADEDLTFLSNLTNLEDLSIGWNNSINDLSYLAGLNLTFLNAEGNEITSIETLENMTNLGNIYLADNSITDITALASNVLTNDNLTYVDLRNNYLDLSTDSDDMNNIQVLIDNGVEVFYDPQKTQ